MDEESSTTSSLSGGDYGTQRKSNLYLDPRSHLGLNFNKSRSELLALALSHPVGYYTLRQDVITAISEQSILAIYDKIWSILGKGVVKADDGTEIDLYYTDKEGARHRYNPNLPEVKISKLAMSVAEQMLSTSNFTTGLPPISSQNVQSSHSCWGH